MSILSSLYNGFSGLNIMGNNMQVLANNIANVNSVAYKSQRSQFEAVLASTLDPHPIGNGATLSTITTSSTVGNIDPTNIPTDMAINGSGFYLLREASAAAAEIYTRDGQFQLEPNSIDTDAYNLVSNMGYFLQGTNINSTAVPTPIGSFEDIVIKKISLPQETTSIRVAANIQDDIKKLESTNIPLYERWDGTKLTGTQPDPISSSDYDFSTAITIYDTVGDAHDLSIYFDHTSTAFEKEFLITCNPKEDRRLIGAGPGRYNDTATTTNKGAGALLYGVIDFNTTGDLESISCWNVPADANVDHTTPTNQIQLVRGEGDYSFSYNFTGSGTDTATTINFGTTPQPQSTISTAGARKNAPPLTAEMIASTTSWTSVYDSIGNQVNNGDIINFTGTTGDGTAVAYSYTVDTTKNVSDLLANLETQFQATATILDGKLELTDTEIGDSQLAVSSITYSDSNGNSPAVNASLAQIFGAQDTAFEAANQYRYHLIPPSTTSYASGSNTLYTNQDGYAASTLKDIAISAKGVISGVYAGGQKIEQARVSLARFTNLAGLKKIGEGILTMTSDAGTRTVGSAGESGLGGIIGRSLEMSNVDLNREFTELIRTQRTFQANSKTITTADEFYQEALRIKR